MQISNFPFWPRRVVQGVGVSKDIVKEFKVFGGSKCIFFTDDTLLSENLTQELIQLIKDAGYIVDIYSDIEQNPSDNSVARATKHLSRINPNFVVYYGGGSVIDLGKAANVLYTHGGEVFDYEDLNGGIDKIEDKLLPSVAIATTAGSGSEVSAVSVITDANRGVKMAILSPYIVPTISVLDPVVTISMPPELTAYTGMDAMSHVIESYVSSVPFEPCRGIALRGVELLSRSLRKAVYHGGDINARTDMLVGSACGSLAFNNNYLGAVHGCAHQLSSVAGLPHGLANAMMLLPVMEWNIPSNVESYADIAKALGVNVQIMTPREAAEKSTMLIRQLANDIGIPKRLSDVGVTKGMIDELVDKAYIDHNMLTNPRKSKECPTRISKEVIKSLYMKVF
jgi:alcohol dehydrogenase class IV